MATILLVDDEPALLRLMSTALGAAGYAVVQARNGAEAASFFQRQGVTIDLLITDMQMPYVDGAELVAALRKLQPSLKVIGISGRAAQAEGTDAFLTKPFAHEELLASVRALLDESRADPPPPGPPSGGVQK